MGGWKQKSGWIQIPPASCVPFTFPFVSQLSVCLIVSRVRAYLTTDQQKWECIENTNSPRPIRRYRIESKSKVKKKLFRTLKTVSNLTQKNTYLLTDLI